MSVGILMSFLSISQLKTIYLMQCRSRFWIGNDDMFCSFGVMDSLVDLALGCNWPLGLPTMVKRRAP